MSIVYIEHREVVYPNETYGYAPSIKYPEYQWDDISVDNNEVYDMIRSSLYGYGLDKENFGKSTWNPLGKIIKQGDTVVIKPNWVEEKNENTKAGLDCLVTNASIIRAVIDYVHIALKGTGRIIVGDSPMPNCNLKNLMNSAHYNSVWSSCKERNISLEIMDFREDITTGFANEVQKTSGESEVVVDLGKASYFTEIEDKVGRFRNGIVDAAKMNTFYHVKGHHRYGINKEILNADVIINLPKPKTHRKAGYTAALKNYIGVCSRKISIPHNVTGNIKEGGDTYHGPKFIFGTEGRLRDMETHALANEKNLKGTIIKCLRIPFWCFRKITHKKYYGTGNWYKNDTIWRAILDINRIVIYANKQGKLEKLPQRKFLSIGDMIIAGEGNGPLGPSPKEMGVILVSEDPVAFDKVVVKIMGFDANKIPVLKNITKIPYYKIANDEEILTISNINEFNLKREYEVPQAFGGGFLPAEGWKYISFE